MTDYEIDQSSDFAYVKAPYNPDFIQRIKLVKGHRWDPETKLWAVPNTTENVEYVRQAMLEVYGINDESEVPRIDITISFPKEYEEEKQLVLFDKRLATIFERRGEVRLDDDVSVLGGHLTAGGSNKYPTIVIAPGTTLKILDVRQDLVENFQGRKYGGATIRAIQK